MIPFFTKISNSINTITVVLVCFNFGFLQAQPNISTEKDTRTLTLMTYNLKFASPTYKPLWSVRKDMQVELFKKYKPDIIATQEGLKEQIDYLAEKLPEYVVVGEGRKGGDDDEHMAIFFKKDKFRLRELNSFALSKTPKIIGSGPIINPRMVTWARLAFINKENKNKHPEDYRGHWKNSKEFYVFNTHFFNGNEKKGRLSASKLLLKRIKKLDNFGSWSAERPIFLMGDFNCHPKSEPHKVLVGKNEQGFFSDTNTTNKTEIDWILYKANATILKYEEINDNKDGKYPSDHKPIFVKFSLNK